MPLMPVRTASAAELPVQRAPSTPSLGSKLMKHVTPQRPAEPRFTSVTVGRDGAAAGHGRSGGGRAAAPPPANDAPPPYSLHDPRSGPPAGGAFDARTLSDGQVDELTHRLIGPLTRLLRTELRLDRERIGRLRDSRR
ncbi:hypothetical protein SAMN05216223_114126 [Actinacidiphila yanglinensis]|uniref:Extensin n=1 Tax=Actinacidiphila yanglinensis TaxID=310779 RepID=A0A1H6DEJ2_9ACTN|nr:hypothetical protein SAMN05216223_114126 [Actinacidiphila yanglinensis]